MAVMMRDTEPHRLASQPASTISEEVDGNLEQALASLQASLAELRRPTRALRAEYEAPESAKRPSELNRRPVSGLSEHELRALAVRVERLMQQAAPQEGESTQAVLPTAQPRRAWWRRLLERQHTG